MRTNLGSLAAVLLLQGCAHRAAVSTDVGLPLRRVVIYRNGVGYFERAGRVEAERISFDVKPEHVGDFLATLAVMDEGGRAVRSAAFPLPREGAARTERESVQLLLDGQPHALSVGYVVEQPIWRPTYRVVVGREGLELQSWGIVQNRSGEDWKDVQLSLVAGAPLAFRATLDAAVTPQRPTLDDAGEVFAGVTRGESTLAQEAAVAGMAPSADVGPLSAGASVGRDFVRNIAQPRGKGGASRAFESLARVSTSTSGGTTRYDLPHTVSIPDASASMVLLSSRTVPGEAVLLFAPDSAVPDSARHPFRVARFKNDSAGLLERGPIAVFEEGSFLGQGVLEPLPAGAQATVPFSLERGLAVEQRQDVQQEGARLALVENGVLSVERDTVTRTVYRVQNGEAGAARVLLRHTRQPGTRLAAAAKGTEDTVGAGAALVPVQVAARATQETTVDERVGFRTQVDWFDPVADAAVQGYLADARAEPGARQALQALWRVRAELLKHRDAQARLTLERDTLSASAGEARESLRALARSTATELKGRLQQRLSGVEERLAVAAEALLREELALHEQEVDFRERVRALTVRGL